MPHPLSAIRKAKNLSQEQLGTLVAKHLRRSIGVGYAQKKIARFEAGTSAPTQQELEALAYILDVPIQDLALEATSRPTNTAVSALDELTAPGGRTLMATCILSRPRQEPLGATYAAVKAAINDHQLSMAVFVPYAPIHLPSSSEEVSILQSRYAEIRRSIDDANFNLTKILDPKRAKEALALYFPKADVGGSSAILIPPVVRQQYSLTIRQSLEGGPIVKTLHTWTPGTETDSAREVKATGVFSIAEQISLWEAFFGRVVPHWLAKNEFLDSDHYWERVR